MYETAEGCWDQRCGAAGDARSSVRNARGSVRDAGRNVRDGRAELEGVLQKIEECQWHVGNDRNKWHGVRKRTYEAVR